MKRRLHITMLICGVLAINALTGLSALAQTSGSLRMRANIPFAFNVGKTSLPAGDYTVTVLNPTSDGRALQIRSIDGRSGAIILTTAVSGPASDDGKLVFHRYADRYFFAKAQMGGDSVSLAATKSRTELAEQRAFASAAKIRVVAMFAE
jgi:hypothetical protein